MMQWFDSMNTWLQASPQWLALAIFLIACLECLAIAGIIIPGTVVLFTLAALAGNGALELWQTLLLAYAGGLLGDAISYTLGRHSNDHMTSFYATTPSGFFVEYGWGAQVIEPDTWEAHETSDGPSYWGHERVHLPEGDAARDRLREMRMDAARRGARAADPVPNCAWLDAVVRQE
jgi:hypothetical protein